MDDDPIREDPAPEELAVARELAALGTLPLPPGVAERLDARLAAELDAAPLAQRRRRRRLRAGAGLSAVAAAAAAVVVLALATQGGEGPSQVPQAAGPRTAATLAMADAAPGAESAGTAADASTQVKAAPGAKACAPASRTDAGRPRPGCPGARGGRARAV